MRKIISLICLLMPLTAFADELQLQENAPERYVVVKGDTLWDISAKFFKDPWKWPQIWGYNKDTIKDPHWIYPGDVVYLDSSTHTLKIGTQEAPAVPTDGSVIVPDVADSTFTDPNAVKLSPKPRVVTGRTDAIPSISLKVVGAFLQRPLVVEDDELAIAPRLIGTLEQKQLLGAGDLAYAQDLPADKGERWQIYRPSVTFIDPETKEVLGHEVMYLGDADVEKFADVSTVRISKSVLEISKGDYFAQTTTGFSSNYLPHSPSSNVSARVISVYGGVEQAGQNAVITLNKGRRDGLESGHVLALYQRGQVVKTAGWFTPNISMPDLRYGLIFVFRVFDKVSYALVMETKLPVQILDRASTPD
ncbi:MAG: LysM peptidoglycan-binding domain-containing protein [Nitrosomonadales bacterium]|nr:LysM peptidoglycan-binding domain-containing protein [Nitrosomonadales bacterium]